MPLYHPLESNTAIHSPLITLSHAEGVVATDLSAHNSNKFGHSARVKHTASSGAFLCWSGVSVLD